MPFRYEDIIPRNDDFFNDEEFEDQFGNDVQSTYRPGTSIDDDSEFGHLLDS